MMKWTMMAVALFVGSAEAHSKAMDLIKKPLIKSLVAKEGQLNELRRSTMYWRRLTSGAEGEAAAATSELESLGVDPGHKAWGFPLLSPIFHPVMTGRRGNVQTP